MLKEANKSSLNNAQTYKDNDGVFLIYFEKYNKSDLGPLDGEVSESSQDKTIV